MKGMSGDVLLIILILAIGIALIVGHKYSFYTGFLSYVGILICLFFIDEICRSIRSLK